MDSVHHGLPYNEQLQDSLMPTAYCRNAFAPVPKCLRTCAENVI